MGERDTPTDGVEDYCTFLGRALRLRDIELELAHFSWQKTGVRAALTDLERKAAGWRGQWVILQYTTFAWSGRGFPKAAVRAADVLLRNGVRLAVVFHEFKGQPGGRFPIGKIRGAYQDFVVRRLHARSSLSIFTTPTANIPWLPKDDPKSTFIPIGANIPEGGKPEKAMLSAVPKTVAVFGITGHPHTDKEAAAIVAVVRAALQRIPAMRLVVMGRGSSDAEQLLRPALQGQNVEIAVKGILPAESVRAELEGADAYLFVRGPITPQRGSALAGIACGVPIVGYRNGRIGFPLEEAGIEWAPMGDTRELACALVRVLTDDHHWTKLHERNLRVHQDHFSWKRIAEKFVAATAQ